MKSSKPLVSIIIPVYNSDRYLKFCLDSVVNQTYDNLEIILVDDESKDSSGTICDEYANKYENVSVIHQKNIGCGFSRNTGLEVMHGDYYTFVDADDYVSIRYVEILVSLIEEYDADMVTSGTVFMLETRNEIKGNDGAVEEYRDSESEKYVTAPSWGKLYRTSSCGHVRYDRASYEDVPYAALIRPYVKNVVIYNKVLYVYRAYQDSITRGNFGKKTLYKLHEDYLNMNRTDEASLAIWIKRVEEALGTVKYRHQEILYKRYIRSIIDDINKLDENVLKEEVNALKKICVEFDRAIECSRFRELTIHMRHIVNVFCSKLKVTIRYNVKID